MQSVTSAGASARNAGAACSITAWRSTGAGVTCSVSGRLSSRVTKVTFCEVAQVVDCHEVTVGHQERKEEEVEQEVKSDGEKTLKERCTWMA